MVPSTVEVRCRAVGRAGWVDRRRLEAEAREIALRYGLSLGPYAASLSTEASLPTFERSVDPMPGGALTEDGLISSVDFTRPIADQGIAGPVDVRLPVVRGGLVNALVLHFRARLDDDLWLSNAPEAPRTHWALAVYDLPEPRSVAAGDSLAVRARLEPLGGVERTIVELVE
jgi:hypothetical protein